MMGKAFHPVNSPWILRRMMSRQIHWQGRPDKDVIYLTFDDGPVPDATPAVLDILQQYDARATFFCVGDNVRKYPDLYARLLNEGHSTGNHSFAHLNGWKTPTDEYVRDVEKARELIQGSLFRPPYGRIRSAQARKLVGDFHIVLWSVLSWDFHPDVDALECLENVRDHSRAGSIVVFHDSPRCVPKLKYLLPRYLEEFRRKGFTFEPLTPECLDTK
jgi:peptidoglycan/xylan/chitin deacetylase (PgdA/CDA1 family)